MNIIYLKLEIKPVFSGIILHSTTNTILGVILSF